MIELLLFFLVAMLIALWLAAGEANAPEYSVPQNSLMIESDYLCESIIPELPMRAFSFLAAGFKDEPFARYAWGVEFDNPWRYRAGDPQRKRVAVPFESDGDKPSPGWRPPGWVPNTAGVYEVVCTLPGIWYSAYDPERALWGLAQPNVESARWALEKIGPSKNQYRIWRGRHRPRKLKAEGVSA